MTTFTPTTEQAKRAYVTGMRQAFIASAGEHAEEFDRWLAKVKHQTLRDAALSGNFGPTAQSVLLRASEEYLAGSAR